MRTVGVVAVAEHGDIHHVRRRRIFPDLGIDAGEVDLLIEAAADPVIAAIGNAREQRRSIGNLWLRSDDDEDPDVFGRSRIGTVSGGVAHATADFETQTRQRPDMLWRGSSTRSRPSCSPM